MTDQRLRELERRAREGGSPEDAARWLLMRERAGELPRERLELLVWLGHAPAVAALAGQPLHVPRELESWVRGLERWGPEAAVRAALAAARLLLPLWSARHPQDPRLAEALAAAERWTIDPGPAAAEAARAAADACHGVLLELERAQPAGPALERELARAFREKSGAVQAALCAAGHGIRGTRAVLAAVAARERLALEEVPHGVQGIFSRAAQDAHGAALASRALDADRLGQLPELDSPRAAAAVKAAVSVELTPWALG